MGISPKQEFKIKKYLSCHQPEHHSTPRAPKVNQEFGKKRRLASSKKRFRTTSKVLFSGTFETLGNGKRRGKGTIW